MAEKPELPDIAVLQTANTTESTVWMGATIKNIETLGEQSAAGVPDRLGVIILKVGDKTEAEKSGLLPGDVIRKIDSQQVTDVKQMLSLLSTLSEMNNIPAVILRNQKEKRMNLRLK